jgi:hypothetical protein
MKCPRCGADNINTKENCYLCNAVLHSPFFHPNTTNHTNTGAMPLSYREINSSDTERNQVPLRDWSTSSPYEPPAQVHPSQYPSTARPPQPLAQHTPQNSIPYQHPTPQPYSVQPPYSYYNHNIPQQYPMQSPHEQRGHGVPHQYPMQSPHEQRGHGVPHQYPIQSPHEQRGHGVPHQYPIQSPHEQRGHGVPHQYPMQSPHEQRGHGASQQYPMQSPHEQRGHGASQQYPMQSPHEQRGHGVPQSYQSQSIPASPFAASPVAEATSYTEQEYLHTWDIPDIGAIISSKDKDTVQSSANAFQTQPGMLPYASDYALSDDPTPAVIKLGSEPPESQELTLSKREKQALSEKGWAYGSREVQSLQYDLENFESDIESLEFDTIRAETPIQSPEQRRPKTPAPDTIPMKRPHLDQQADTSDNDTLKNSYASKPLDYNFRPSGNMATPDGLQRLDIAKTPKNQTPSRAELALSSDQQIDLGDQAMLQNSPPLDPNRHPDHKDVNHELPTLKGSSANSHNDSPTSHPPVLSPAQWSSRPPEYDLSETSTENQTSSTNSPPDTEQMSVAESIMPPLPRPKLSENFSFALNTQLPPLWRRFCAGIIDLLLLGVIAGTITKVFGPQLKQTLPKAYTSSI